jgi:hypothetical protein
MGKASVSSHLRLAIEPSHLSKKGRLLQAARYSGILARLKVKIELIRRPASGTWDPGSPRATSMPIQFRGFGRIRLHEYTCDHRNSRSVGGTHGVAVLFRVVEDSGIKDMRCTSISTQDSTSASRIQAITRFECPRYPISRAAVLYRPPQLDRRKSRHTDEVLVSCQQRQRVADAELCKQCVNGADLNSISSARVAQLSGGNMIISVRSQQWQGGEPFDN